MLVWIVDDDAEFGEIVAAGLGALEGHTTKVFTACSEALNCLGPDVPSPDAILLDISFPRTEGIHYVPLFKNAAPQAKVIMLTGVGFDDSIRRSIQAGANGYVIKGSGLSTIATALETTSKGFKFLDPMATTTMIDAMFATEPRKDKFQLTEREQQILRLIARGYSRLEIAKQLGLAIGTVISHLKMIFQKLRVSKATEAVAKAMQEGLL